jgi:hypothetical protein
MLKNEKYALVSLKLLCKNVVKLDPLIKPCILFGVILFLVYDG